MQPKTVTVEKVSDDDGNGQNGDRCLCHRNNLTVVTVLACSAGTVTFLTVTVLVCHRFDVHLPSLEAWKCRRPVSARCQSNNVATFRHCVKFRHDSNKILDVMIDAP